MKFLLIFVGILYLQADSFITEREYAKMLYQNPRGIGCHKCHGMQGEGKVIVNYIHKNKNQTIKAPKLTNISKEKFFEAFLNRKRKSVMPEYFLTKDEIEALYLYLRFIKEEN